MRFTSLLALSAALLIVVASSGCGGGSGGGSVSSAVTAHLPPIGALDGFVDDHGFVDTVGMVNGILAGDNMADAVGQGFYTFDMSAVPGGAEVLGAWLEIRQHDITGSPYSSLGSVLIDHVDVGGALDTTDWGAVALDGNFAPVSHSPALGGLTVEVTDQLQADVYAGRTRTSYRLGFTALTDGDGTQDTAHFQDTEDSEGSGILPRLVVRYLP